MNISVPEIFSRPPASRGSERVLSAKPPMQSSKSVHRFIGQRGSERARPFGYASTKNGFGQAGLTEDNLQRFEHLSDAHAPQIKERRP